MSKEAHGGTCTRSRDAAASLCDDDDHTDVRQLHDDRRLRVLVSRRVVTRMIRAAGDSAGKHYSLYHRVSSVARWSLDWAGLAVFDLISPGVVGKTLLAIDDTLARKRGQWVFGCGMHHDPRISSRGKAVMDWGTAGSYWA